VAANPYCKQFILRYLSAIHVLLKQIQLGTIRIFFDRLRAIPRGETVRKSVLHMHNQTSNVQNLYHHTVWRTQKSFEQFHPSGECEDITSRIPNYVTISPTWCNQALYTFKCGHTLCSKSMPKPPNAYTFILLRISQNLTCDQFLPNLRWVYKIKSRMTGGWRASSVIFYFLCTNPVIATTKYLNLGGCVWNIPKIARDFIASPP